MSATRLCELYLGMKPQGATVVNLKNWKGDPLRLMFLKEPRLYLPQSDNPAETASNFEDRGGVGWSTTYAFAEFRSR